MSGASFLMDPSKGLSSLGFTADDFCKIISMCAKSGVRDLKIGKFHVQFGHKDNLAQTEHPGEAIQANQTIEDPNFISAEPEKEKEIAELAQIKVRSEDANEEIQHLILTDPHEYEAQMAQGALEDAQEKSG